MMAKIFSARIDESYVVLVDKIANSLHTTKKAVVEKAIGQLWAKLSKSDPKQDFINSFGAWKRTESIEDTVTEIRTRSEQSFFRRHQS